MYRCDENSLKPEYFLRPIENPQEWTLSEKRLQIILRQAADTCYKQGSISKDECNQFYISGLIKHKYYIVFKCTASCARLVTAKEIYRALQNNKTSRRILCFFREIIDIEELDSKFREIEDATEAQLLLNEIKNVLHQSLDSMDIRTYRIHWNDTKQRTEYFTKFFDDFFDSMKNQIDYHMEQSCNKRATIDPLYDQIIEHAIQCNLLIQRYFPRKDILEQVRCTFTIVMRLI
ncbi:unnamed protein product [Rotaria sp. Silwood1]|nr:unnamed protein product [Rotaria sp. Silwood1]CAF1548620.1 unnamed protein product [Rotaria sp. Silwood1]CAF3700298.1 unnamed protein product [Rotaria sp. Silwood1]CAF4722417.1 unnamed protein product [Rotaria sp. Silwood1]